MFLFIVAKNRHMKLACIFLCLFCIFNGGYMRFDNLTDSFRVANKMIVSFSGTDYVFEKGNDKFEKVILALEKIVVDSHEMPAFGVSLDEETRKEKNKGIWIELLFDSPCKHDGMDFESLLIKVEKEDYAFNLIRKYNGKYEGRCFHLSLASSTKQLYDAVESLSKQ